MATPTVTPLPNFVIAPADFPGTMMPNPEIAAAEKALLAAAVAERKAFKDYYKDFGASRNENDILKNHALWVP